MDFSEFKRARKYSEFLEVYFWPRVTRKGEPGRSSTIYNNNYANPHKKGVDQYVDSLRESFDAVEEELIGGGSPPLQNLKLINYHRESYLVRCI